MKKNQQYIIMAICYPYWYSWNNGYSICLGVCLPISIKQKARVVVWNSKEWGNCIGSYKINFIAFDDT
ncbi:hypothetical protein UT300002_31050 [Clostridium perfringens]